MSSRTIATSGARTASGRYHSCALPRSGPRPMTRLLLLCALAAFSIAPAMAGSFAGSSAGASSAGSSASSGSTSGDDKAVLQARDDAAGFVALAGRIRAALLEAALRHLQQPSLSARQASAVQHARAIPDKEHVSPSTT